MLKILAPVAGAMLLYGCVSPPPISKNLPNDLLNQAASGAIGAQVQTDIADTQYDLTQAVQVGALSPTDPAPQCVSQAVAALGIGAQNPNFTPKISGVFSFASVAYVRAQQLKALAGSGTLAVPEACKAIIGQMQLDALAAALKAAPGGGLLPTLQ